MAATDEDCLVGDDMDTFTLMNEDITMEASSSNDARCQRDVSRIFEAFRAENYPVEAILPLQIVEMTYTQLSPLSVLYIGGGPHHLHGG